MHTVYGDTYFTRPAIHVWGKKFADGRESVVDEEEPGRRVVSTTDATIAAVDFLMWSNRRVRDCDGINVYMNLGVTLKNESIHHPSYL